MNHSFGAVGRVLVLAAMLASAMQGRAAASGEGIRTPADSIGYAVSPGQIEAVVSCVDSILGARNARGGGERGEEAAVGGICPHDDYLYAGHLYVEVMREIRAPLLVLIGVAHRARRLGIEGRLVFDGFDAWRGPYGPCPVSPVRDEIIGMLPADLVLVDEGLHAAEHSLEALIPFVQYCERRGEAKNGAGSSRRGVQIVPVLVTRFRGERMTEAAGLFADALHAVMERNGWKLGRDLAVLISADCVHYGDDRWGGRGYAPFGVDGEGYDRAVAQDLAITGETLCGEVSARGIALFRERVERDDLEWPYKVTWCGVYAIPFGLDVLVRLCEAAGGRPPEGIMLDYATSLSPGDLPLEWTGLGVTNINTLRHWVGYTAVIYR